MLMKDVFKYVPRNAAEMDLVYYSGIRWIVDTGKHGLKLLTRKVSEVICEVLGKSGIDRPEYLIASAFTSAVVSQLQSELFDLDFFNALDGETTRQYIMYSDGLVEDRDSKEIYQSGPEHVTGLSCGYKYPATEIASVYARLGEARVDMVEVFNNIKTVEQMAKFKRGRFQVLPEEFNYTDGIVAKLDALAQIIPGLQALRQCFKSWVPVMFALKQLSRARYGREQYEELMFWFGMLGRNGKGMMFAFIKSVSGEYAKEPKASLFVKEGDGNAASPMLLAFKGRRFLLVPEVDARKVLMVDFMKSLRDQTAEITARGLYKAEVSFMPQCLTIISTNVWPTFSSVDGGVEGTFTAMNWPFTFNDCPDLAKNEKKVDPEFKKTAFLTGIRPGWIVLLRAVDTAFTMKDTSTTVSPKTWCTQMATERLLEDKNFASVQDFVREFVDLVADYKAASTRPQVLRVYMNEHKELTREQACSSLKSTFADLKTNGRDLLQDKATRKYVMLRCPSQFQNHRITSPAIPT